VSLLGGAGKTTLAEVIALSDMPATEEYNSQQQDQLCMPEQLEASLSAR